MGRHRQHTREYPRHLGRSRRGRRARAVDRPPCGGGQRGTASTRRKLEIDFPRRSIAACLDIAGVTLESVAIVACDRPTWRKRSDGCIRRRRRLLPAAPASGAARSPDIAAHAGEIPADGVGAQHRESSGRADGHLRRTLAAAGFGHATLEICRPPRVSCRDRRLRQRFSIGARRDDRWSG